MVGHSAVALPAGPTQARYKARPILLKVFLTGRNFSLYLSNAPDDRHRELAPSKATDDAKTFDHFAAISGLPPDQFNASLRELAEQYWPSVDLGSTLEGLQRIRVSPSRSTTPKRTNESPEASSRLNHQRRITTAAHEQEEACKNLQYAYFTEDHSRLYQLSLPYAVYYHKN
jgi:hypothetical protein